MQSGRKPWGSRTAISFWGDMMTSEYAPLILSMAAETASSMEEARRRSLVMV